MPDLITGETGRSPLQLVYDEPGHGPRRVPALAAANMRFEVLPQVTRTAPYKGQSNRTGQRWTATVARHVAFRSWLERDNLMAMDFETDLVAIAAQPFTLLWRCGGRERKHTPAYFARLADGTAVLADVYGAAAASARRAEARAALAEVCDACGWTFRLLGALDPVYAANLRWLSGYRHPRNCADRFVDALLEVFSRPHELLDGAIAVGDPIAVLPTLYHLMWGQELTCDLRTSVLGCTTVVSRTEAGTP